MSISPKFVAIERLSRTTASTLKKAGWRAIMDELRAEGRLLVTNHEKPEAVILPVADYAALMQLVEEADARIDASLATLRDSFDQRLAVLQEKSAARRLQATLREPVRLAGKVKAGTRY